MHVYAYIAMHVYVDVYVYTYLSSIHRAQLPGALGTIRLIPGKRGTRVYVHIYFDINVHVSISASTCHPYIALIYRGRWDISG